MRAIPQETTDYIADQFRAYFGRKEKRGMNIREAQTLIDFVSGPVPYGGGSSAIDPGKQHVSGGGRMRPSAKTIEGILNKHVISDEEAIWDEVFGELIKRYREKDNKRALRFIKLCFKLQKKQEEICEIMGFKSSRTYNDYRLAILTLSCMMAIKKGLDLV